MIALCVYYPRVHHHHIIPGTLWQVFCYAGFGGHHVVNILIDNKNEMMYIGFNKFRNLHQSSAALFASIEQHPCLLEGWTLQRSLVSTLLNNAVSQNSTTAAPNRKNTTKIVKIRHGLY
jgi:hypothetical protein